MITRKSDSSVKPNRRCGPQIAAAAAVLLGAAALIGCGGDDPAGTSSGQAATTGAGGAGAAGSGTGSGGAGGSMVSPADALLEALDQSRWHGLHTRGGKERAYELQFNSAGNLWAEIRNPFGPARKREMRTFSVDPDGESVHSAVVTPAGWAPDPEEGRMDDWTLKIIDGPPRVLQVTRAGVTEAFDEGPWPAPTDGLTAEVRVFASGGAIDDAFCSAGTSFDYAAFFDFARGLSTMPVIASDIVAGAKLSSWHDVSGQNNLGITDVQGFDLLGGTELTNKFNFFVRYTGAVVSPGGELRMRELDDTVEDGLWAFLASKVGSKNTADLFLEVHGFVWADSTPDEVAATVASGDIPIEIILVRCANQIDDVDVQIGLGTGPFQLVGDTPSKPAIDDTLFPPAL
jgi:hypothetical protein